MTQLSKEEIEKELRRPEYVDPLPGSHTDFVGKALRMALQSLEPAWRPISEAPKDKTQLLVCNEGAEYSLNITRYSERQGRFEMGSLMQPTHFMLAPKPLPTAPSGEKS